MPMNNLDKFRNIRKGLEQQKRLIENQLEFINMQLEMLQGYEADEVERQRLIAEGSVAPTPMDKVAPSRRGRVYLLRAENGLHKIGRTANPSDRLKTFSVKLPFQVQFEHLIETNDMYALESKLHKLFAEKNIAGEWFELSPEDVLYIKDSGDSIDYDAGISDPYLLIDDELYGKAVELVRRLGKASISLLQRRLGIGYTRASRLIDIMENRGIVGSEQYGSKPREVMPDFDNMSSDAALQWMESNKSQVD